MKFSANSGVPIFMQIANSIEEDILIGVYGDEMQIPSTTEISVGYKINPATVLKGINILVDQKILYKKRGVGMFVSTGARELIKEKRSESFYSDFVKPMVNEAKRLSFSKRYIIDMINKEEIN
ncbi:MAG: GntR family transcriptional regulator [Sphaerochaetaceae bacterium]|jgi:DNA-binding transcriptional regulator YhcF (GntR family)|nr:GntR family transcriptional regulator [Sphaerochaetaceae bacterium]